MKTPALKIACALAFMAFAASTPTLAGDGSLKDGSLKDGYEQPTWIATYSGTDFAKDSFYSYSGAVISLQHDLSRSGFVFQGFAGYGSYEYDAGGVLGRVDGDITQLAAMIGYLFVREGAAVGIYVGADYNDVDLTPNDPLSTVNGSEVGLRIGGDVRLIGPRHYFSLEGYYSTGFDTYWSRARAGVNMGRFIVGPEAAAMGNDGYDAQRLGGFAMFKLDFLGGRNPAELTLNGGYQFVSNDGVGIGSTVGGEGAYVGLNLGFAF